MNNLIGEESYFGYDSGLLLPAVAYGSFRDRTWNIPPVPKHVGKLFRVFLRIILYF